MKKAAAPPTTVPPYLRIVNEIKRRISVGDLSVGARVPSTRDIAKDWRVAIATATKALSTLRQEGVIEAVPRVGAVVLQSKDRVGLKAQSSDSRASGERADAHADLTRERIVRAAIGLADAQGLDALSMRGVAAKLDAPTMSLYRHVGSKDELVRWMTDAVCGEYTWPKLGPSGWRARLTLAARSQWALYRRHPWSAQVMSITRPLALPNVIAFAEWMLASIDGLGLSAETMMHVHITVYSYVRGLGVNLESERQAEAETGISENEWVDSQATAFRELVASGSVPTFARIFGELSDGYDLDLDALFEFGLTPLLDGLSELFRKTKTTRKGARKRRSSAIHLR